MHRSSSTKTKTIGLIEGAGTGSKLIEIFKGFLHYLVDTRTQNKVQFIEDIAEDGQVYCYQSYASLSEISKGDSSEYKALSLKDAERLEKTFIQWYQQGVCQVFRTSINADALYLFRQKVKAIKAFGIKPSEKEILFVRDQAEGFYANLDYLVSKDNQTIDFNGRLTSQHVKNIVDFANKLALTRFGQEYQKWVFCKFHLFPYWEQWYKDADSAIQPFQPDTGIVKLNEILFENGNSNKYLNNHLVICSNEVGDLIYETVLHIVNEKAKTEFFTKNYYLGEPFNGELMEYQTAHGSADDIAGTEKLLPYATLRIAAEIAENLFDISNVQMKLDQAIGWVKRQGIEGTTQIIKSIYEQLEKS